MKNAICYAFSYSVEAVILWQYASSLFISTDHSTEIGIPYPEDPHKNRTVKRMLILACLYLFLFLASLMENKWLNAVLFLLANFIYLVTQYHTRWFSALFHSAILTAVMGMCELVLIGIISCCSIHFFDKATYFRNLAILTVFSKILYFLISYILTHLLSEKQQYNTSPDISAFLPGLIPGTSVFVMLTFITIGEVTALPRTTDWLIILSGIFLLISSLLAFALNHYSQKKHVQYTETLLLLQKESDTAKYYEMLLSQHDNQSILIHDIKKHLQSIDLLNDQHDHEKISAYIKQLLLSSDLQDASRLCDHALLNAILCRYKKQCSSLHITFLTDIRSGTVNFMANNDITSLFCNLLDNSVEACKDIPEGFIELTVQKKEKTPFVVITVINSCRKNPFSDRHSLREKKLLTTKPDKRRHGFGIKSIRKVISKYQGDIQMYYNDDTPTFHSIITLKHKKN